MMQLDLVVGPTPPLSLADYTSSHPSLFQVSQRSASYAHPITGVHATLRWDASGGVTAQLPLGRPSFWGPHLVDMIRRVGRSCNLQGIPEDLGDQWAAANRSAWSVDGDTDRPILPDDAVALWGDWNSRLPMVRPLYVEAHVAEVRLVWWGGRWCSGAIWTDLGPTLLPPVDVVLVLCAGLIAKGCPPGLVALEREQLLDLTGPIPANGLGIPAAADDPRWLQRVKNGAPVAGKLTTMRPEDGREARFT